MSMLHPDDQAYYWIRAAEELERAAQAKDSSVAAVHHELAYRYGALAAQEGPATPKLTLVEGLMDESAPENMTRQRAS